MARVQWVNLPGAAAANNATFRGDGADETNMGRTLKVVAKFDKTDPPGQATLTIAPGPNNAAYDDAHAGEQALMAQAELHPSTQIGADGKVTFQVLLSAAGGDRFKLKVNDDSEHVRHLEDVDTRRRLYYQVIGMKTVGEVGHPDEGLPDYGFLEEVLKKDGRAIELVKVASKGSIDHSDYTNGAQAGTDALFAAAKAKYDPKLDPYCFAVIWVDVLVKGPFRHDVVVEGVQKDNPATVRVALPPRGTLWKEAYTGIASPIPSFGEVKWRPGTAAAPGPAAQTVDLAGAVTDDRDGIDVATAGLPAGTAGYLSATLVFAAGFPDGLSFTQKNVIVVAARAPGGRRPDQHYIELLVAHEAGHKLGLVPSGAVLASGKYLKKQSTHDDSGAAGHDPVRRAHCSSNSCIMWWADWAEGTSDFCAECAKSLRRTNLVPADLAGFTRFY